MEKPKLHVVSFSGGKDSTAMLLRMIEENMPIDIILYCDTGLEFPEMEEHIRKVEEYIGRKITILKASKTFDYYRVEHPRVIRSGGFEGLSSGETTNGYGWPTMFSRWCTVNLKTNVIDKYLKNLKKDYDLIEYVGIAADEPKRKRDKTYPLIEWGMTEKECLEYCYRLGFDWGGLYEFMDRVSCWCCPLQSLNDLRKIREHRPKLWDRLRDMDTETPEKGQKFKIKLTVEDIERRFKVEDEFVAQGKKIRSKEFYQTLQDRGIPY